MKNNEEWWRMMKNDEEWRRMKKKKNDEEMKKKKNDEEMIGVMIGDEGWDVRMEIRWEDKGGEKGKKRNR